MILNYRNHYQNTIDKLKNGRVEIIQSKIIPKDGKWISARFYSECPCGRKIKPGDDLWYTSKRSYCYDCGVKNYPEELRALLKKT